MRGFCRRGIVFWLLLSVLFFSGCMGDSHTTITYGEKGFSELRREVLEQYYDPSWVKELERDASAINFHYGGVNVFTTCQYGTYFLEGTADIGDVFDARNAVNYGIFEEYARKNWLILNPPETNAYWKYALAATCFMSEFGYDAVLFHPDEFHPVLTDPSDTWMFLRDDPDEDYRQFVYAPDGSVIASFFISGRVNYRHETVRGGIPMEPLNNVKLWLFYIPRAGNTYHPYEMLVTVPVVGSTEPDRVNPYVPVGPTPEMLRRREEMGIVSSPYSGWKGMRVGTWKSAARMVDSRNVGFTFSGVDNQMTYGGHGLYLVPLEPGLLGN